MSSPPMCTVWKFNGNSDGKWEVETPLQRPMVRHRSYVINNQIWHVASDGRLSKRYYKLNLLIVGCHGSDPTFD